MKRIISVLLCAVLLVSLGPSAFAADSELTSLVKFAKGVLPVTDEYTEFENSKGESFGEIFEIPTPGMHRPFAGHLSDGRILLSYREFLSPLNTESFQGTSANLKMCIFTEDMLKEAEFFETHLIDRDNAKLPDQGYSAWAQLDDGSIIMANYIVDDAPKAYIRGYRMNLEEK